MNFKESRIVGIDAFRLAAAFSVILLHVGNYAGLHSYIGIELKLLGRWAVPFFFIVSGYFLAPHIAQDQTRLATKSAKTLTIFIISNILFIPLLLTNQGILGTLSSLLSFKIITQGTSNHLWFLSSLTFAMFVFYSLLSFGARKIISVIVVGSLIILLTIAYHPDFSLASRFARYISCFPFMYLGIIFKLKNINPQIKVSITILCVGFLLQNIEVYILSKIVSMSPLDHEFLIGTFPFAIGMFFVSLRIPKNKIVIWFSDLGIKYSLGIYIFHPYFTSLLKKMDFIKTSILSMIIAPLAFFLTLSFLMLLSRKYPLFLKIISGDQRAIQQVDRIIPLPAALPRR